MLNSEVFLGVFVRTLLVCFSFDLEVYANIFKQTMNYYFINSNLDDKTKLDLKMFF